MEERLEGRYYLADELSLADIAHDGNFVRLCKLEEGAKYPSISTRTWRPGPSDGGQGELRGGNLRVLPAVSAGTL